MRLLIIYLVLVVPICLVLLAALRLTRGRQDAMHAAELHELEASRDLIDRLLDAAVDRRDVDSVLAPLVIDEIRTHQRALRQRRDGNS